MADRWFDRNAFVCPGGTVGQANQFNCAGIAPIGRFGTAGVGILVGVYLLMTILRSVRADFAPEIWNGLGYAGQPAVFTNSEILVTLGVVAASGLTVLIRNNRLAFFSAMGTSLLGFGLAGLALAGLRNGWVDGFTFMVLVGLGLYLPYVAVHTTVFERLLAMTGDKGNIGFLMYLADSFGYLGYVAVMLARGAIQTDRSFLDFFTSLAETITVVAFVLLIGCWVYFRVSSPTVREGLITSPPPPTRSGK